jgi:hypothetical protein
MDQRAPPYRVDNMTTGKNGYARHKRALMVVKV